MLDSLDEEFRILADHIKQKASPQHTIEILEAGCGNSWELDLAGVSYALTGVDIDEDGMNLRKSEHQDLDEAIVGDLRTAVLEENHYDVIYNSHVLEHVEGAPLALDNFHRWLKPGGILILRLPDRDSVYGFCTRLTPFWFHVFYKRYLEGNENAGRPGFGPFPTVYDKIVSREGIRRWCAARRLIIRAEYGSNDFLNALGALALPARVLLGVVHVLSLGRLAAKHSNLTYVIEKPVVPSQAEIEEEKMAWQPAAVAPTAGNDGA